MKARFEAPSGVRFTCSRCGDCCRQWNVLLGPGERQALEALDWKGRDDGLAAMRPAVRTKQPGQEARYRLRRRADGSCIYLGDENQCLIHEHFGAEAKPLLCRLYPFGFYPVGDRIGIDVSFSCRAVSEGSGEELGPRIPEWARLLEASDAAAPGGRHRLRPGVALPAELVWEIEHHLLDFLSQESLPLVDRVRCAVEFLRIGTTGDPTAATAAQLRQAMAKGIPIQIARRPSAATMDKTQRAIFYQWLFLCLNPPPHDYHEWSSSDQESEKSRRLKAGRRYLKQKGQPWVDNRELEVSFRDVARVDAGLGERDITEPLETYLKAKIVGQKFLVAAEKELPLVEAALKFFLTVPMTLWTAKALAAERRAGRLAEGDLRRALRLVDRTLGALPTSALPRKQAQVCDTIMLETDLVEAAVNDVVVGR